MSQFGASLTTNIYDRNMLIKQATYFIKIVNNAKKINRTGFWLMASTLKGYNHNGSITIFRRPI